MICTWHQRNGQPIYVHNMENGHLVNCVKYIARGESIGRNAKVFSPREWIMIFTAESVKRIRQGKM